MSDAVEKTRHLAASPERVWNALTDPEELGAWFPDETELQPREGSSGWFGWSDHGKFAVRIVEMDPPKRLVWTWARDPGVAVDEGPRTTVEWTLTRREDGGTTLRVRETGFADPKHREQNDAGWDQELEELVQHLEEDPVSRARPTEGRRAGSRPRPRT